MGVEQRELLVAVDPVLGIVDVEHDPLRHLVEAVAEQLDHRRHHALERPRAGQVLEPAHDVGLRGPHTPQRVGCEHRSAPLSGSRPTAILNAGSARSASQSLASSHGSGCAGPRTGSAGRDQERPEADHLGELMRHPIRCARVLEAARQALGDREVPLDFGKDQNPTRSQRLGQRPPAPDEVSGLATRVLPMDH